MNPLDLYLREHAAVHSAAVADADFHIDWMLVDLSEAQWRLRPHGLNSLAWLIWHIAQVEDACLAPVVLGALPLLDDDRASRLNIRPRDAYNSPAAAEELTRLIDLPELRAYRDDVGRRTRTLVGELWPDRWQEPVTEADIARGAAVGGLDGDEIYLVGKPRESLLFWWGLTHIAYHIGQMAMVRRAFATE